MAGNTANHHPQQVAKSAHGLRHLLGCVHAGVPHGGRRRASQADGLQLRGVGAELGFCDERKGSESLRRLQERPRMELANQRCGFAATPCACPGNRNAYHGSLGADSHSQPPFHQRHPQRRFAGIRQHRGSTHHAGPFSQRQRCADLSQSLRHRQANLGDPFSGHR